MIFVKVDDLKAGMRIGKPIYNKNGVLLHERDSRLTLQGIYGIKNFGLLGLYILEPAEPVPPMTEEDILFERFQTMACFSIKEDLDLIVNEKQPKGLDWLASVIIKNYGTLDHKINFIQGLRSSEDYIYKHSLNVAILTAVLSNQMGLSPAFQNRLVISALLHDVGRLKLVSEVRKNADELTEENAILIRKYTSEVINKMNDMPKETKRIILQCQELIIKEFDSMARNDVDNVEANILYIADVYDRMTAMKSYEEPTSEVKAIRDLLEDDYNFNPAVVKALVGSVNVLEPGVCVELSNKKKGLVISANYENILRPVVLAFEENKIYDLSDDEIYSKIQIYDVMKTMDNRIKVDENILDEYLNQSSKVVFDS